MRHLPHALPQRHLLRPTAATPSSPIATAPTRRRRARRTASSATSRTARTRAWTKRRRGASTARRACLPTQAATCCGSTTPTPASARCATANDRRRKPRRIRLAPGRAARRVWARSIPVGPCRHFYPKRASRWIALGAAQADDLTCKYAWRAKEDEKTGTRSGRLCRSAVRGCCPRLGGQRAAHERRGSLDCGHLRGLPPGAHRPGPLPAERGPAIALLHLPRLRGGPAPTTTSMDGVGYSRTGRSGAPGALRGGGFKFALIDSDNPSRSRPGTGVIAAHGTPVNRTVTSTHSVNSSGQTAWGFNGESAAPELRRRRRAQLRHLPRPARQRQLPDPQAHPGWIRGDEPGRDDRRHQHQGLHDDQLLADRGPQRAAVPLPDLQLVHHLPHALPRRQQSSKPTAAMRCSPTATVPTSTAGDYEFKVPTGRTASSATSRTAPTRPWARTRPPSPSPTAAPAGSRQPPPAGRQQGPLPDSATRSSHRRDSPGGQQPAARGHPDRVRSRRNPLPVGQA